MTNKNITDPEDYNHDYWPNELAQLRRDNFKLYKEIVESNLDEDDTVESWENRNLKRMQNFQKG